MVSVPPLCIIQARLKSTRIENKMLLKLGGETLIARAHRLASEAFGLHVVVAIPAADLDGPLGEELARMCVDRPVRTFAWAGADSDVLGRFHDCAHFYRWHPDSVIVRWTPDDPFKDVAMCQRVARGERLPVEQGAEAFTLNMLDTAHEWLMRESPDANIVDGREHITRALFEYPPPPCPPGCWTVDTAEDYEKAKRRV